MLFFSCKRIRIILLLFCVVLLSSALSIAVQDPAIQKQQKSVAPPAVIELASDDSRGLKFSPSTKNKFGKLVNFPHTINGEGKTLFLFRQEGGVIKKFSYDFGSYIKGRTKPSKHRAYIADPLFSIDGSRILFKYVVYENFYQLYVLDLNDGSFSMVSDEILSYYYASISPSNKYVAFVVGGDVVGDVVNSEGYIGPLQLFVVDLKENSRQLVAEGDFLNGSLSWGGDDNLFYSAEEKYNKNYLLKDVDVSIYSYNAKSKKSVLITKNGLMPSPSPDGSQVVIYGSPNRDEPINWTQNWRESPPKGISLVSVNKDGDNRIAFEPVEKNYPSVNWIADNQRFVSLQEISSTPTALAQLRVWDIKTQSTRSVVELQAKDKEAFPRPNRNSQFEIIKANSSEVVISKSEFLGYDPKGNISIVRKTLMSVDVVTGLVKTEVEFVNTLGYDVHLE